MESALQLFVAVLWLLSLRPDSILGVEVVVTPRTLLHLLFVHAHLRRVDLRKALHVETQSVQIAAKHNSTFLWRVRHIVFENVVVRSDDDVGVLKRTSGSIVHVFSIHLQLMSATVDFVHEEIRHHALLQGLKKRDLGLYNEILDAVDNGHRSIGDLGESVDLRRDISVTWRIDEADRMQLQASAVIWIVFNRQRVSCAFDDHAALLLVRPCIGESGVARLIW